MDINLIYIKLRIWAGNIFRNILWKFGCDWLLWKKERFVEYPWIFTNIGEKENQKILDIGVGSSIFPLVVASLGHDIYALDLEDSRSKDMKKLAQGIPFYHFIKGDATALPFKNSTFDNVFFISSLEHINFPKKAILEAERVLRKNGRLLITLPYGFKPENLKIDFSLYNKQTIKELTKDRKLTIKGKSFFVGKNNNWIKSNEEEADKTKSTFIVKAIICLRLEKS